MMIYTNNFIEFVNCCLDNKRYVGTGNPNSNILIVGKEVNIDIKQPDALNIQNLRNYKKNALDWDSNIKLSLSQSEVENWKFEEYLIDNNATNNPLHIFKSVKIQEHKEGATWRKYQKLSDFIFEGKFNRLNDRQYDFQERLFLTELNDSPNRDTKTAKKDSIEFRKHLFMDSPFIQEFPVVILSCSNYIWNYGNGENRQIDNIFKVNFREYHEVSKTQQFWTHYNDAGTKLVIHTRQLSSNTSDLLLEKMATQIRQFLYALKKS